MRHGDIFPNDVPKIPESSKPWGTFTLMLLTLEEFEKLPNGTILIDIFGMPCIKDAKTDTDTRFGFTAYGFLKEGTL